MSRHDEVTEPARHPTSKQRPTCVTPAFTRRGLIAGGVTATAALAAGGGWWWNNRPAPAPLRIAVLPFADRSPAQLDQPLANGVTEDVIRTLGRHPALEVVTFDAVARLTQTAGVLAEAARRLDVAFALVGEMLRQASVCALRRS